VWGLILLWVISGATAGNGPNALAIALLYVVFFAGAPLMGLVLVPVTYRLLRARGQKSEAVGR
jgi:hypothetical protein